MLPPNLVTYYFKSLHTNNNSLDTSDYKYSKMFWDVNYDAICTQTKVQCMIILNEHGHAHRSILFSTEISL
jgi:hypothetical protein